MKKNQIILLIIAIVVVLGTIGVGIYYYQIDKKSTQINIVGTSDWQIYQNTQYKISLKYPGDWQTIDFQTELGMGTLDSFGFIPSTANNQYCNLEQDISSTIQNYKKYNPNGSDDGYAQKLVKVSSCSILVRVEKNPDGLNIKDYLKKNYLPIVGNLPKDQSMKLMEEKINGLVITKDDGVERLRNTFAFHKYQGGSGEYDNGYLATDIENKDQVIINNGGNIFFFTRNIDSTKIVDQNQINNLFEGITNSFKSF